MKNCCEKYDSSLQSTSLLDLEQMQNRNLIEDYEACSLLPKSPEVSVMGLAASEQGYEDCAVDGKPKMLVRNPEEIHAIGYSTIEVNLEMTRDNLRDKGLSDGVKMEAIIQQKRELLRIELQNDAFNYGKEGLEPAQSKEPKSDEYNGALEKDTQGENYAFNKYDTTVTYSEKMDEAILVPWNKETSVEGDIYKILPPEEESVPLAQLNDGYDKDILKTDSSKGQIAVYGDPFSKYEMVVSRQGLNRYRIKEDCGLVACTNAINIYNENKGHYERLFEKEIVDYAVTNHLCDMEGNSSERGCTSVNDICAVLEHYQVPFERHERSLVPSLDQLANEIKKGKTAVISVSARDLWDASAFSTAFNRPKPSDHAICVTGVVYDVYEKNGTHTLSDKIKGFYIVDTGRTTMLDKARFVSFDRMSKAYWKDGHQLGNDVNKMCLIIQQANVSEVI